MKYPRLITFSLACSMAAGLGCQSKFSEKEPQGVAKADKQMQLRLDQKANLDKRLGNIKDSAEKVQRILALFRKVQNPNALENVYTPIDFVMDASAELQQRMPEIEDGGSRSVRKGKIRLPVEGLSKECQEVEVMLKAESGLSASEPDSDFDGELSLKACGDDQFLTVLKAEADRSTVTFEINNENFKAIFENLTLKSVETSAKCKITKDDKGVLDSIQCSDVRLPLSASEVALVENLIFSNSGPTRLHASAKIFELGQLKAVSTVHVDKSGKAELKSEKAGQTSGESDK